MNGITKIMRRVRCIPGSKRGHFSESWLGKQIKNHYALDNHALSPIFATVLLAAIIILVGSATYYFSSNLTTNATNQYVNTISTSQQALSERLGFENVIYTSSPPTLSIYVINYGIANNIQINSVLIYDSNNNLVGTPYSAVGPSPQISKLYPIATTSPSPTPISNNALNVGQEGYFTVTLGAPLVHGAIYTIQVYTKNGSSFNYVLAP